MKRSVRKRFISAVLHALPRLVIDGAMPLVLDPPHEKQLQQLTRGRHLEVCNIATFWLTYVFCPGKLTPLALALLPILLFVFPS